jgi:hypothetical protein
MLVIAMMKTVIEIKLLFIFYPKRNVAPGVEAQMGSGIHFFKFLHGIHQSLDTFYRERIVQ